MNDQNVRHYLTVAVGDEPDVQIDVEQVIAAGRRRRRRHRLSATAAAVLTVGTVAATGLALHSLAPGASTVPPVAGATTSTPPTSSPSPSAAGSAVRAVEPGQRVPVASDAYLTLTRHAKCLHETGPDGVTNCKTLDDGNQATGSVSLQGSVTPQRAILHGIYQGTDAAAVTVTIDGRTETATVVELADRPGVQVYVLVWPAPLSVPVLRDPDSHVDVYDAQGDQIASLRRPG